MELFAAGGEQISSLFELLALVLAAALFTALVLIRLKQSIIIGYFLCGVLVKVFAGAAGMSIDEGLIRTMADLGVVLLLFTLGIEFSIKELTRLRRIALIAGSVQMAGATALAWGTALFFGLGNELAFFIGFLVGMSSTAVSLKVFQDMGQGNTPAAHLALGVAIFQDILVIGFMLLVPLLFAQGEEQPPFFLAILFALGKGGIFLLLAWALSRYVVPPLLGMVAKTRSRELFTLLVLALCASVGYLGNQLGLSIALGAFVAGLVVSESVYSHRILADILPFKDFFITVFFVSVGLMIDLSTFAEGWPVYLLTALSIVAVKTLVAFFGARLLGFSAHDCLLAALSLSSIGEFSLVLLDTAYQMKAVDNELRQFFLITAALSMSMIPVLVRAAGPLGNRLDRLPFFRRRPQASPPAGQRIEEMRNHAIVCGYGPVGRGLVAALKKRGVTCLVVEMNALTVQELKAAGQPCIFADISQVETLHIARAEEARILALTFPSFAIAKSVLAYMREANPETSILCRTKFVSEARELQRVGADIVVQDEQASSVEMIRKSLELYDYSEEMIRFAVDEMESREPDAEEKELEQVR